jgi:hypothetical protein
MNPKIAQAIRKWGLETLSDEREGALRDWTPEICDDLRDLFDNHLDVLLHDDYFLGLRRPRADLATEENVLYGSHEEDIMAIYEENKKRPINLVILIEGIGSGKTTLYSVMTWLEWVRLLCRFNPHRYYGLMLDEIIAFIAMNRSETQAKRVTLQKVFPKFKTQFNLEYFPPSKRRGQEIWIPRNNTLIFAGTSNSASALGYNIFGGGVDEANFLESVEGSRRNQSSSETYDAAKEMHDAINGRMTSRFLNPITGHLDGMLFMISSSRYPDDFLEKKAREHFKLGEKSHIFVRRRTLWEAKPKWYFSGITVPFNLKTKQIDADEATITALKAEAEAVRTQRQQERLKKQLEERKPIYEESSEFPDGVGNFEQQPTPNPEGAGFGAFKSRGLQGKEGLKIGLKKT